MSHEKNRELLRYLNEAFTEPVRDPLWKHIYLTPALEELIGLEPFLKLDRIKQLGPSHRVYPGATHTRLSHSLGVFHLARRILQALITQPESPVLSLEGAKAFLCAALLHDLGHFPYAHSLKELPLKEHEALTGEIIQKEPLAGVISDKVGTSPAMTAAIVDEEFPLEEQPGLPEEVRFFRRLLSGVLDPDKLDYLNRDAYFCGIPYGLQDLDFVISQLAVHPQRGMGIREKGLSAVENILFSKFLMYKTVYWHNRVRTITAAMKKSVFTALADGLLQPEALYGLDDAQFLALFSPGGTIPANHSAARIAARAEKPGAWAPAVEVKLTETVPLSPTSYSLTARTRGEATLARELTALTGETFLPEEVILDVSPPISFEVDLPILGKTGWVNFPNADTVFQPAVVQGFTENLRHLMVILPAERLPLKPAVFTGIEKLLKKGIL